MTAITKPQPLINQAPKPSEQYLYSIEDAINKSWQKIAPLWPLKNFIAVNPLSGLEPLPFEQALRQAQAYFQQPHLPPPMLEVNRQSIKWLQAFFDNGQSTISMPMRELGLLGSTLRLLTFDTSLHGNQPKALQWLADLPHGAHPIIQQALAFLGISQREEEEFLTLMLTTLPGWAAYTQYRTAWADAEDAAHPHPVTQIDYLAFRLVLTCLLWPEAKQLLTWHKQAWQKADTRKTFKSLLANEKAYQDVLCAQLQKNVPQPHSMPPKAQLVFCIDVRSEPFRRALETQGEYQTYGFAGFFGVPIAVEDTLQEKSHSSCPVLLKPAHTVYRSPLPGEQDATEKGLYRLKQFKRLYQSLKYTFATPFLLVEALGPLSAFSMAMRNFFPKASAKIKKAWRQAFHQDVYHEVDIRSIPFEKQVTYAATALRMIGLTQQFAPLVVFCGHSGATDNNAYATSLDCGACGGHGGETNAKVLASILNSPSVREALQQEDIRIPAHTYFLAAEHNTTTDALCLDERALPEAYALPLSDLRRALQAAQQLNSHRRAQKMGVTLPQRQAQEHCQARAQDWAQVRPEWGLAGNAAFIVGPRHVTQNIDLEGRAFLHSYAWEQDTDGAILSTILTAPMVVAQWINAQYLFSSVDNVAFGAGSKVTQNITGKIGIMQGNASDLMHGLPLQSVYATDDTPYHSPMRLTVVVCAPRQHISPIIEQHAILQTLFGNGWVTLLSYDPASKELFTLRRDLSWTKRL